MNNVVFLVFNTIRSKISHLCIPLMNHDFFINRSKSLSCDRVYGAGSLHSASSFYWSKIYQPTPYSLQQKKCLNNQKRWTTKISYRAIYRLVRYSSTSPVSWSWSSSNLSEGLLSVNVASWHPQKNKAIELIQVYMARVVSNFRECFVNYPETEAFGILRCRYHRFNN